MPLVNGTWVEPTHDLEHLISEDDLSEARRCREEVIFASGNGTIEPGTIVGKITADGKYAPLDPGASDGSEAASGVIAGRAITTDADARGTITARDSVVNAFKVTWPDGITDPQKDAAIAELAALGIMVRE